MKKLFPILLALALLSGCAATYDGPTTTEMVLSQTRTEGFWDDGSRAYCDRTVYFYDIYGNQAQSIHYQEDEANTRTIHRYNEDGNLLRTEDYYLGGWFPKRTYWSEYTYDDQNRIISVTNDYSDGDRLTYTIEYDDEANTKTTRYESGLYSVEYFNDAGHLMRCETIHKDGTMDVNVYTRRPDGQPLTTIFTINGEEDYSILYEYDDQGRVTCQTSLEGGVQTGQFRWVYDDENNCETRYNDDGSYVLTGYNADGTKKVRQSWDENGKLQTITLYDYREIRVPIQEETP